MVGKTGSLSICTAMASPSRTESCTLAIALTKSPLERVSRVICKACKIGTPLLNNVPKVRVIREILDLPTTSLTAGTFNPSQSKTLAPGLVFLNNINPPTVPIIPPSTRTGWVENNSLMLITI